MRQGTAFLFGHGIAGGFSLLELLVVMVIVGLTGTMVGVRLIGSLGTAELKTSSRTVVALLRHARTCAVTEKKINVALFDLDVPRVTILERRVTFGNKNKGEDNRFTVTDEVNKIYPLPETITFKSVGSRDEIMQTGAFEILFFPKGCSSGGDVVMENERGKQRKIRVDGVTGIPTLIEAEEDLK